MSRSSIDNVAIGSGCAPCVVANLSMSHKQCSMLS
jgi:hypothetical protein